MEKVLVVPTALLRAYIDGKTGLIRENSEEMLKIIGESHLFLPRAEAEEDPSYKQIIPYVLLRRGEEVFTTRRLNKGGEARLHGKISVGVGGHINPVDEQEPQRVLLRGLERELSEEVEIERRGQPELKGFINDDTNGVGSVHLGLCCTLAVEGEVSVRETEKLSGGWMTLRELKAEYDNMETWTRIALEVLE